MNNLFEIPWWQVDFGESAKRSISRAIEAKSFSMGEITLELEYQLAKFLKVKNCIAVTNGSTALLLTLKCLGVNPGDEVIIQDRTWIAAANAAHIIGAKIKFADVSCPPNICLCELNRRLLVLRVLIPS